LKQATGNIAQTVPKGWALLHHMFNDVGSGVLRGRINRVHQATMLVTRQKENLLLILSS
jgi:hypothetical protein